MAHAGLKLYSRGNRLRHPTWVRELNFSNPLRQPAPRRAQAIEREILRVKRPIRLG